MHELKVINNIKKNKRRQENREKKEKVDSHKRLQIRMSLLQERVI